MRVDSFGPRKYLVFWCLFCGFYCGDMSNWPFKLLLCIQMTQSASQYCGSMKHVVLCEGYFVEGFVAVNPTPEA